MLQVISIIFIASIASNLDAQTYCGSGPTSCVCSPIQFVGPVTGACGLSWFFEYAGGCTIPATSVGSLNADWDCNNGTSNPPEIRCGDGPCGCPTKIRLGNGTGTPVLTFTLSGPTSQTFSCGGSTYIVSFTYVGGKLVVTIT